MEFRTVFWRLDSVLWCSSLEMKNTVYGACVHVSIEEVCKICGFRHLVAFLRRRRRRKLSKDILLLLCFECTEVSCRSLSIGIVELKRLGCESVFMGYVGGRCAAKVLQAGEHICLRLRLLSLQFQFEHCMSSSHLLCMPLMDWREFWLWLMALRHGCFFVPSFSSSFP